MAKQRSTSPQDRDLRPERLPAVTRAFHWTTVVLLAAMFALIWTAGSLEPGPLSIALIDLHRSVGLTLLLVALARLGWRLSHPLPPLSAPLWERWLAESVQAALYACIILMPLLGWAGSDMAGDTVRLYGVATLPSVLPLDEDWSDRLFVAHGWVAWALLALIALHVAGALRHRFIKHDGVFERMSVG